MTRDAVVRIPFRTMNSALAVAALVGLLYASVAAQSQTDLKQLLVLISCAMICIAGIGLSFRNIDGVRAAWLTDALAWVIDPLRIAAGIHDGSSSRYARTAQVEQSRIDFSSPGNLSLELLLLG